MPVTASVSFPSLVLPKEHGSWSFAFEPVVLGLLVAPSRPGLALACAVGAGFFVRRPLKLAVTLPAQDLRWNPAARWAVLLATLALAGTGVAALMGSWTALWPLLICVPFGAIFLWFDLRNVMREAEAELAGSTAFALVPAVLATLAGWETSAALGLAALGLARSLPTVLAVRTYVRRAKGRPADPVVALVAAAVAWLVVTVLAQKGMVPVAGPLLTGALFLRALVLLTLVKTSFPAKRIGQAEAVVGVLWVAALALGYQDFP